MLVSSITFIASEYGEPEVAFKMFLRKNGVNVWEVPFGGIALLGPNEIGMLGNPNVEADYIGIFVWDVDNPGHIIEVADGIKTVTIPLQVLPDSWKFYHANLEPVPMSPWPIIIGAGIASVAVIGIVKLRGAKR